MESDQSGERAQAVGRQTVSLTPYVIRFSWVYIAFMVVAFAITTLFGVSGNTGLSIGILIASALTAGQKFVREQKRVMSVGEKITLSLYSLIVSLVISIAVLLVVVIAMGGDPVSLFNEMMHEAPLWIFVVAMIAASLFYFAALYLSYHFLTNMTYRNMLKRGEIKG